MQVEAAGEAARRAERPEKRGVVVGFLAGQESVLARTGGCVDARQGRCGLSPTRDADRRPRLQIPNQGAAGRDTADGASPGRAQGSPAAGTRPRDFRSAQRGLRLCLGP